jgi:glycosyltransferase involved in cell wall biosynthesis
MRIFVHDYPGHPLQITLSRELARFGHVVQHAFCPSVSSPRGSLTERADDPETFSIRAIPLNRAFDKYGVSRIRQEREYGRRAVAAMREFAPDVVVSANTPLLAQRALATESQRTGIPFVFWLQDLLGVGIKSVLQRRSPLLGRAGDVFVALERRILTSSDAVIAISDDFRPILLDAGVDLRSIHIIENWAPLDELPVLPRDNAWSRENGLDGVPVVLYAGTLGLKHDGALIVAVAERLAGASDATIVIASEGPSVDSLRQDVEARGLSNVRFVGFQPYERLPEMLATGDVFIAVLDEEAGVFSVPSKILTYLCAQRPIVAAVPSQNLAARVIQRSGGGVVVDPTKPNAFADAVEGLLWDGDQRRTLGIRGRRYAEREFSITRIAERFESVLSDITGEQPAVLIASIPEEEQSWSTS